MQTRGPKISVIIPTFNRADYLVESLESVLNQTYKDFEVIVVDDGSTDNTEEVLQPYMHRIKYVKQENQGVSGASNRGIKEASGEYVAFQGSDDVWLPDKLEKQMNYLRQHPEYVMVTGNGTSFGIEKDEGLAIPSRKAARLEREGISLRSTFMKSSIRGAAMIVKKSVIEDVGGFDTGLRSSVDVELAFRVLKKHKIGFQNEILIKIRKHKSNLGKDRESGQVENIKAIKRLLQKYPDAEHSIGTKNVGKRLAYRYYRLAKICGKRRNFEKAIEHIRMSNQYCPASPKYLLYRLWFEMGLLKTVSEKSHDYVKMLHGVFASHLQKQFLQPAFLKWLQEELTQSAGEYDSTSRHAGTRRVAVRLNRKEHTFYVKRYFSPRLSYALKDIFRSSKALRAWNASLLLERFGFHTAPVVVAGEKRKLRLLKDAFFVTDAIQAPTIPEFARTTFSTARSPKELGEKRKLVRALAAEVGRMHLLGIVHGDLLPGNILVDDSEEPVKFIYIDNDRTRRSLRMLPEKPVARNLVQLGRFPLPGITLTDRLRFFRAYIEQNPRFKGKERQLLALVVSKTRERVLKIERAGDHGAKNLSFRMLMSGKRE